MERPWEVWVVITRRTGGREGGILSEDGRGGEAGGGRRWDEGTERGKFM